MAAPPGASDAACASEERALALLAPAGGDDAAQAPGSLAKALQELVVSTFDPPSVDSDEAIARALAEEEEEARRRPAAPPPEDVSRDVAVALACQLDEISRSAGAVPVAPPPQQSGAGLDAAVAAAVGGLRALPWALGAPPPPPSADGRSADLARLRHRLHTYGLEEGVVRGDGNCQVRRGAMLPLAHAPAAEPVAPAARAAQFRALADQLYRSEAYHAAVRAAVCSALAAQPDRFAPYVVGDWDAYLASAAVDGTWGDHVTLQARLAHLPRRSLHGCVTDALWVGCC